MGFFSRRSSAGTNTTRVHSNSHEHDPARVPGETTDGSGPLYPSTKQAIPHHQGEQDGDGTAFGDKSPGVRRIEIIGQFFEGWHKWVLFFAIFLIAYVYGLDGFTRYAYQSQATSSFSASAQISTVSVVRAIVAAAAQPAYAKVSDYFGRVSILLISCLFYVIGTIVMATGTDVSGFAGGAVLYQFGFTGVQLLVEVLIADLTSLRNRVFFSYIPAMPSLINTWVSGYITSRVLAESTWQWGIGECFSHSSLATRLVPRSSKITLQTLIPSIPQPRFLAPFRSSSLQCTTDSQECSALSSPY